MPSITSWTRLEPRARNDAMTTSLQARVHDPLWMLARQWQFGEFQGEDAGSPVHAQLKLETNQIERYYPGRPHGALANSTKSKPYDNRLPLETWVEHELIVGNYRLAAEAGLQFFRLLGANLASKYRAVFLKQLPLNPPSEQERRTLDSDSARFLAVMARRAIDGVLLRSKFSQTRQVGEVAVLPNEPPFSAIDLSDSPDVVAATTQWLDWYDTLFSQPQGDSAWVQERMEYEFAVSAPVSVSPTLPPEELVLTVPEYSEGHLDWYSFAVDPNSSLGARGQSIQSLEPRTVIPTPVHFRGMPAARWWEFEDAGVNFGGVETAPEDLARLLLTEFALIYGNDFFIIPIDLPVGSVSRISSLIVINTFGQKILIQASSQVEGPDRPWRMFSLSLDYRVALHVNLDKMLEPRRETFTAQAAWVNRC